MFDVGFAELFLLALIGLLVLGPERLPGVARTVGGFVRKARTSWNSLRHTIETEMADADLSAPIKQAQKEFKQIGKDLSDISGLNSDQPESNPQEPPLTEPENLEKTAVQDADSGKEKDV